jgi:hypothetical protein
MLLLAGFGCPLVPQQQNRRLILRMVALIRLVFRCFTEGINDRSSKKLSGERRAMLRTKIV